VFLRSALINVLAQGISECPKKQFSLGRMVAQPTAFHHNSLSHPSDAESIRHSDYPFAIGPYVLVAVFVDNLDFVKGLPWWTYPVPLGNNG
jgi:hypothetical protein